MAQRDEHRMVFDIRGRRRHAVKFVYAILAVLMGLSLFLVTGAVNLGSLFGSNGSSGNPAAAFEEQAERIETKLKKSPEDENLLLALSRARATAGNTLVSSGAAESSDGIEEIRTQLNEASNAWTKYLNATTEPSAGGAQILAPALFLLAQAATNSAESEENVKAAAEAQEIVAEGRPSLNSYSTLAEYLLFSFDYKGAEEANAKAAKYTNTKFERESLENKLTELEKNAKEFQKSYAAEQKARQEAAKAKSSEGEGSGTVEPGSNALGSGLGGASLGE